MATEKVVRRTDLTSVVVISDSWSLHGWQGWGDRPACAYLHDLFLEKVMHLEDGNWTYAQVKPGRGVEANPKRDLGCCCLELSRFSSSSGSIYSFTHPSSTHPSSTHLFTHSPPHPSICSPPTHLLTHPFIHSSLTHPSTDPPPIHSFFTYLPPHTPPSIHLLSIHLSIG